jgi:hypothetical protein
MPHTLHLLKRRFFTFVCLYTTQIIVQKIFLFFFASLQLGFKKKLLLVRKNIGAAFGPFACPTGPGRSVETMLNRYLSPVNRKADGVHFE